MKEIIHLSRKYNLILITIFLIFMISGVIYFTKNYFNYQNELKLIIKKEIKGIIVVSKDGGRGHYYIEVNDAITKTKLSYILPQSWFFKNNDIRLNDSVYKKPNSNIMVFYKFKNGIYEKCCDYEIAM